MRNHGFTLIEMLIVFGILALLGAALMTSLGSGIEKADKGIDKLQLMQHYGRLLETYRDGEALPEEGGAKFVYYPWVAGKMQRTPEELESFFHANSLSPRLREMLSGDTRLVATSYDEIDSECTDFAGRAAEHYTPRMFTNGHEPLMATDNEQGNAYSDGSVLVLYGNGAVREIARRSIPEAAGDPDYVIEVGPESPVADLRKLRR